MAKHACGRWTYFSGMATCPHGYELLPDGKVRKASARRWKLHRSALTKPRRKVRQ
jgi:hypothetical protein